MTVVKTQLPRFLNFAKSPNLSQKLMVVGLVITILFIFLALFAPVFQAWGWLQDPHRFFE
ncbi:MAG: hypothetical protein KatS3mg066_1482 [Fischerella sp.]|nr:MAG: hypothetical protein KatS3mg066_1482 [Fischerella sp.]